MLGGVDIHPGADILTTLFHLPGMLVSCYKLPDKGGKVYHLRHTDTGWADELFEVYQREASGTERPLFERKPLKGVRHPAMCSLWGKLMRSLQSRASSSRSTSPSTLAQRTSTMSSR